jgi:hypothetical protein
MLNKDLFNNMHIILKQLNKLIHIRETTFVNEAHEKLSETYFTYGVLSIAANDRITGDEAIEKCGELNFKREIWKIEVIRKLMEPESKGWLLLLLECGLFGILDELYNVIDLKPIFSINN